MICTCHTEVCRGHGTKTEAGDLKCPTTETIEAAAVAGVREAGAEGGALVATIRADAPTVLRVLAEGMIVEGVRVGGGLCIRPIRKPRKVQA